MAAEDQTWTVAAAAAAVADRLNVSVYEALL